MIKNLQKLQSRFMNLGPGASSVHQSDIDNCRVMITRIFSRRENCSQGQKATVRHLVITRKTAIHNPIQQHWDVRVKLQNQNYRKQLKYINIDRDAG